jgi:16S rRNA (uracil1498-N3)-methyltransferase
VAWLYLSDDLTVDDAVVGARVFLRGPEARHALQVARTRVGERIAIGDGDGLVVEGPVLGTDDGELMLEVDAVRADPQPQPELWLAQALAKGDRDELAIQAATELGVAGIVPWAAERSVVRWEGAKAAKAHARWETIVREAAKQSIRARVPRVAPLASTRELGALPGTTLVLDPGGDTALSAVELPAEGRVTLVVGPEGGVAPRELDLLAESGAAIVRLGPEVLRTSTAGPSAIAALLVRLGRW